MKPAFPAKANIEIKARLRDLAAAQATAARLGARHLGDDRQVDTYFHVPRGRLKLRRSESIGEQLIAYVRPDEDGPRRADYELFEAPRGGRARELLLAMFGIDVEVVKTRRLYLLGTTRIHLDSVEGLGDFLEIEAVYPAGEAAAERAAHEIVARLMGEFGVTAETVVPRSYRELLLER